MKQAVFCLVVILSFLAKTSLLESQCPFCTPRILDAQTVLETENMRVLIDYAPCVKGHLLVIPKRHIVKAHEMTKDEWQELSELTPKIVKVFQKKFNTDQYLIIEKNGPLAGQSVPHVHFHFIPIPTEKMSEVAKITLFTKIFNIVPQKLTADEINQEVKSFRDTFNKH